MVLIAGEGGHIVAFARVASIWPAKMLCFFASEISRPKS
jgi:hypothetical protein